MEHIHLAVRLVAVYVKLAQNVNQELLQVNLHVQLECMQLETTTFVLNVQLATNA